MWESVLGISIFPHAVVVADRHIMMTGPPKASVVSLLFAFPFGDRQSPRTMSCGGDVAPSP
jgi:hypothetical protein